MFSKIRGEFKLFFQYVLAEIFKQYSLHPLCSSHIPKMWRIKFEILNKNNDKCCVATVVSSTAPILSDVFWLQNNQQPMEEEDSRQVTNDRPGNGQIGPPSFKHMLSINKQSWAEFVPWWLVKGVYYEKKIY